MVLKYFKKPNDRLEMFVIDEAEKRNIEKIFNSIQKI
ncbi:hypothetical protein LCGC14_2406080 [marine sediment metagenome]|uniref:Uncharacterized protein n=1 Tax=marine sediment metagenome TaxID=412755 RepID=A0A0F9E683_9ZZZZ